MAKFDNLEEEKEKNTTTMTRLPFHVAKLDTLVKERRKHHHNDPVSCAGNPSNRSIAMVSSSSKSFRFLRFLQKQQLHFNFVTKNKKLLSFTDFIFVWRNWTIWEAREGEKHHHNDPVNCAGNPSNRSIAMVSSTSKIISFS
ncbi:hypothetical protein TNCT_19051 [Trichonephila clavata]|uniref:Uncharacterized protein n=1 Tax=Trichonephila clavata TaxID=2740835 RepID=A0A8X6GG58_TRICU|nr:hypothetical protein TNCT_19051 [Trichonephila clavata]